VVAKVRGTLTEIADERTLIFYVSTVFLHSSAGQISHGNWQNEIGVFAPLKLRGLGFTIVVGISD
jgi:hypothetical protein